MARPPRIPVWIKSGTRVVYFITLCVKGRKQVLTNPATFRAIVKFCEGNTNWRMSAAVIMPDHLHALVSPCVNRDQKVTQFSAGLKRSIPRNDSTSPWEWQHGVFDRLLRRGEFTESKWFYMRENPVRARLVTRWENWPYMIGFKDVASASGGVERRPTIPT